MRTSILFSASLFACDIPAQLGEPVLCLNNEMHTAAVMKAAVDESGKYLLTASRDKTARLWNAADGSLLRVFRVPVGDGDEGMLYACALSPNGKVAAVAGWTSHNLDEGYAIYLFDTGSGELTGILSGELEAVIQDLEYSPDGTYLVAGLGPNDQGAGVLVYSSGNKEFLGALKGYSEAVYDVSFGPDGSLATIVDDGFIRLYDDSFSEVKKKNVGPFIPRSICFSPDGRKLAVGYAAPLVQVFDVPHLKLLYSPSMLQTEAHETFSKICFSTNGYYLYAGGTYRSNSNEEWIISIRRWSNAGEGEYVDHPVASNTISDVKPLRSSDVLFVGMRPELGAMSDDGEVLWVRTNEDHTLDLSLKDKSHFRVNHAGSTIGFTSSSGLRTDMTFNVLKRTLEPVKCDAAPNTDAYGPIRVTDWERSAQPRINDRPITALQPNETSRSVDINSSSSALVLGCDWHIYGFDANGTLLWRTATQEMASAVNIAGNDRVVVATVLDGTIRWYRMGDGTLLLNLFVHPDGERWALWTPSGYYDCSPGAEDLIGWHVNNGTDHEAFFYPLSKFRSTYYRPDVIDLILETYDEAEALALANEKSDRRESSTPVTTMLPPVVNILSPAQNTTLDDGVANLVYRVSSPNDEPVLGVIVQVNGRPVQDIEGAPLMNEKGESTVQVTLAQSASVGIIARNRHGYSEAAVVHLTYSAPTIKGTPLGANEPPVADHMKPKLYALVIGVGNYQNPGIDRLQLAAKDASDFASTLNKQEGLLYADVEVRLLTDDKATKEGVLDGLEWLEQQVTQKDVAMLFLSGHGREDNVGNFYYLPVNASPDKLKSTCVNKSDIMSTVQNISGKVLLFMDACHSGNVGTTTRKGGSDVTGLINELIDAQNGTIVFTSSRGSEFSLEDKTWGNGAFTKALLEGLNGEAAVNGRITQMDLGGYIMERVKEITGGKQHPTFNQPPGQDAFPLALVAP